MPKLTVGVWTFMVAVSAAGQVATRGLMVEHEIKVLDWVGGGRPFNAQEREQAAQVVDRAMRDAPDRWRRQDFAIAALLSNLARGSAPYKNALWDADRYAYAFPTGSGWPREFAIEQKIIGAHESWPTARLQMRGHLCRWGLRLDRVQPMYAEGEGRPSRG